MKIKEFSNDRFTIYLGDVLDCFSRVKDESVDLVFADPPYNIGKEFVGAKDKFEVQEYINWMECWIGEIDRVIKATGSIYLMNSTQNFAHMDLICRSKFFVQSRIVWAYDSSSVQAKKRFGSSWEPILHMTKNKTAYTFNSEDILVEAKTGSKRKLIDYRNTPPRPYNNKKVPSNVWKIPRVRFKMDEYEDHPTQKPHALLKRMILASSNQEDTVLDPFSGSFSTGYACKNLKRRFIGFDISEEYVKIGIRRLDMPSNYSKNILTKNKERKKKNKSKQDHRTNNYEQNRKHKSSSGRAR